MSFQNLSLSSSEKSERWTTPDLFYTVDSYMPNGMSQRVVMIDTPQLVGVFTSGKNQEPEGKVFHINQLETELN